MGEAAERELTEALAGHDAARADLESILARLQSPEVGQPGGTIAQPAVPVGEFGAPGARGYKPGAIREPRPPTAVEAATGDVTAIGKRVPAVEGTPVAAVPAVEATPLSIEEYADYKQSYGHAADAHYGSEMHYSKGGDEIVNPELRSGKPLSKHGEKLRDGLDVAFGLPESRIPRDTILYRGLSDNPILGQNGIKARFESIKPGDVIEDPAYTSTTFNEKAKSRNEEVVFTISAPRGTPALPIRTHYTGEGEMLLPRGIRFKVDSVDMVPVTERWTIEPKDKVEVLADKSVRFTKPNGESYVKPPIKDIKVSILNEYTSPASRPPRVTLDAPIDKLSRRQIGEYQDAIDKARKAVGRGTPEYEALGVKWDEVVAHRNAIEDGKIKAPELEYGEAPSIPDHAAIKAHEAKAGADLEQTLPTRVISDRGYYEPPGGGVDKVRMGKAKEIFAPGGAGQREPVSLSVTPSGRVTVVNGRHRLAAAIEADAPLKIRWSSGAEPSEDMVLRGAPAGERFSVQHPHLGKTELTLSSETKPLVPGTKPRTYVTVTRQLADGETVPVATAEFAHRDGGLYPEHVTVDQPWQRQGIGTKIYKEAERKSGLKIIPSENQTVEGRAFSAKYRGAREGDDLMSQLQGTAAKLDEGHSLGKLSAESPAKAEYVAEKVARTAEAGRHFRAEALAKRDLAEPWNAGFGESTPYETSAMAGEERVAQRATRDATPTSAFRAEDLGLRFEPSSRTYHPLSVAKLEADLEAATAAAEGAGDIHAAQAKIDAIEEQLSRVGARPGPVEDVAAIAEVATKYEQASARLSDALGEAAPPVAKEAAAGVRAAEDTAERKGMDRTTRAIDDHVERQRRVLPWEEWKRGKMEGYVRREGHNSLAMQAMGRDYQAYKAVMLRKTPAGAAALDTDVALARTRITETEARMASRTADRTAKEARAAAEAARPGPPVAADPSTLGTIATAIGIAGEVGVPGIPHPKDIPVIGPLLSIYLKYRAIKAATGRFAGRVSATGDTRAAALVAKAKDRIAVGVDRMLGLAAEAAPRARGPLIATATVLGHRIFDDGEPDAPKGSSSQELAATRIREITAAATRPDLVTQHVRRELHGITDPDLIAAAEQHLIARFRYLASVMPKAPPENPFSKTQWLPSPGAASDLAQRLAVVHDPPAALQIGTPAAAETLQKISPKLFELAKQRLIERVGDLEQPMPYQQRLKGQLLFGIQLDASMSHIAAYQDAFSQTRATPQSAAPQSPPVSSIATPTSLSNMYQTAGDRRAARI